MNRLVLIGIILVSIIVTTIYFIVRPDPIVDYPEGYTNFPQEYVPDEPIQNEAHTIETANGTLQVRDIRNQPETLQVGNDTYALYGIDMEARYPFAVTYTERDDSFAVALLEEPLRESRLQAEASIQDRLGISQEEMCGLNIFVGVPVSVNEFFGGRNLGLSFCSGAVEL